MEEMKAAVDEMKEDKAPGPDGFNVNFIKICWDIVHKYLIKMVKKSQRCENIGLEHKLCFSSACSQRERCEFI